MRFRRVGSMCLSSASPEEFSKGLSISRICRAAGSSAGCAWPLGHLTDLRWNPRPPVAIPGELEGIPGEVSGWNGSELNSERIHVRFSRNRRWNSGGWHRPGEAESGGFLWGGPPGGPLGLVWGEASVRWEPREPPPVGNRANRPEGWEADSRCGGGRGEGPSAIGTVLGKDPEFAAVRASSGGGR